MIDYQDQAKQFLLDCNATMEIKFVGKEIPAHWKVETKPHNKYQFTITTPKCKCQHQNVEKFQHENA